jgi:ABC-2 type transport system permease protein
MHKIWTIARHEYLVNVRRPGFIIMTALVPLLGILGLVVASFFGGQASTFFERQFAPEPKEIGVVDNLGVFTPILPAYQEPYHLFADEQTGREALRADEIATLLVIPEDYVESGQVMVVSKGSGFSAAMMGDSASVRAFLVDHLVQDEVDPVLHKRLVDPIEPVLVSLEGEGEPGGRPLSAALNFTVPYFLGLLLVMSILISSVYLLRGVAEEKTGRVIEIVLSSVTAWELLAGKVLGLGALGLTQVVVWLISAFGLSGGAVSVLGVAAPLLARPEVFVLGLVYYMLGFLVYAVLMGAAGALGSTMQESQQLAGIFSMMAAIPLILNGFIISNPNMPLLRVLSWFPLTAPTVMMQRLPMAEVPLVDIVGSIVMLVFAILAVLWAGSKVFRMGLLMYGKRPSLGQVMQSLRGA